MHTTIHCEDRWQVYHRLQALDIDCQCSSFQPLQANIQSPTEAIQLWSVVRCASASKEMLAQVIQQSWEKPCARHRSL
ncbi:MAG: hypothetical protein HC800_03750 [Phormidesmis sp. RL_2_1]|nr:hypothetical protein [Phormidesmis sp. RL_2_1]